METVEQTKLRLLREAVHDNLETVTGIKIKVSFPLVGFDNSFFKFPQTEQQIPLTGTTVLELYVGGVDVAFGVHM